MLCVYGDVVFVKCRQILLSQFLGLSGLRRVPLEGCWPETVALESLLGSRLLPSCQRVLPCDPTTPLKMWFFRFKGTVFFFLKVQIKVRREKCHLLTSPDFLKNRKHQIIKMYYKPIVFL
jgi:hypothetical protein